MRVKIELNFVTGEALKITLPLVEHLLKAPQNSH